MKLTTLILILVLFSTSVYAQELKNTEIGNQLSDIDSILNEVLKDHHVAGFAVAVVKGDEVIYSKGFGYRDVANKKVVTPNTLFAIGSATKAFTASLLGLLQKEGKIELDGKATDYLPSLRFYNQEMNSQITVRDLIAHRTGIERYDYSWILFNTSNRDSIIHRIKFMQPTAPVRQKWLYNNFMYLVQGMIVEKMTGKTWEQNIKEKFFVPLAMNRSNTDIKEFENDSDASLPYLTTDSVTKKIDYFNISGMGPAGSINSSVNDIANWLKVWISGGYFNKKEILPSSYIGEAASAQMVIHGGLPAEHKDIHLSNYGLGWMISSYRGHYMVEHGGNINGFSANVAFFPSDKLGIVVLTNQNNSPVPDVVRNTIADKLFHLEKIDWNGLAVKHAKESSLANKQTEDNTKVKPILNTKPSHALKDYTGVFENGAYGKIKVWLDKGLLYASAGENKMQLKHVHFDVFDPLTVDKDGKVDSVSGNHLFNFISSQDGKIQSISLPLDDLEKPIIFEFKQEEIILSLKELEKYTGEYDLGNLICRLYIKDNKLFLYVPGQPDYETLFMGNDIFNIKALNGYSLKFEGLEDGKTNSVSFIQPNGVFKASRKM